jgi:hypothetical protein
MTVIHRTLSLPGDVSKLPPLLPLGGVSLALQGFTEATSNFGVASTVCDRAKQAASANAPPISPKSDTVCRARREMVVTMARSWQFGGREEVPASPDTFFSLGLWRARTTGPLPLT